MVFPNLEFTRAGTYTFTVSEVAGSEARVTYDKRTFTVTVEVADDGSGKLSAAVANDAPEGAMVFTNTMAPSGASFATVAESFPDPSSVTSTVTVKTRLS